MEEVNKKQSKKTGRHPKDDPARFRYSISFNEQEHARFLSLFEQSGMKIKAHFITACVFQRTVKTIKIDKSVIDFYTKLTHLYAQFRSVGTNYNQVVKILYRHFSEKKAGAFLYKLEKQTAELAVLCKDIIALIAAFEAKHFDKDD